MNTTGKDINASPTLTDTDHTQKHLILRFTRKTKQFVAFGLLLLASTFITPVAAQTTVDICSRTAEVQTAILAAIPSPPACSAVTATQLAAITSLNLASMSITTLQSGDFADLSILARLFLSFNNLTTLPADLFSGLTSLTTLSLNGNNLSALPDGLFSGLTRLTDLRLQGNTFTTPLPANLFDPLPDGPLPSDVATIQIDLSPIGDLTGVALSVGGMPTINVANAFISRDGLGNDRTLSYTLTPANTAVATATESSGVVTINGVSMGTTTVSVLANDGVSGTVGMLTRDIAVTVVGTGILAFDAAMGDTIATPIVAEASGTDTFYVQLASAPASDVTLTLTSSDTSEGTVMPGTLTFTAAAGTTSWDTRQALTVTAVDDNSDRDDTFTVDFAIATAGDGDSGDYTNLLTIPSVTVTVTDDDVAASICSRTTLVQTAILAAIPGSLACDAVIESQLAAITGVLFLDSMGLTTLLPGDLAGLSGITTLFLDDNDLTTLPSGIFSDLGSLSILSLDGSGLATLPAGVFDGLTSLNNLNLEDNALTALPAGLFDGLTSLTELNLTRNALTTLPANAFSSDLTSVATLFLNDNALTTIDTNAFSGLTSLITLDLSNNILTALPDGAFTGFTSLASLRLNSNTFTTPLPATLFDSLPDSAGIRIDLSPIGDLADIPSLTLGGVATINVAEAFISGDATGNPRTITYTITPTGTSVASATESGGVLTITASDTITGVTTIDIVADDSVSSTVTRNIAVTVVEVGLAFFEEVDSATGSTEVTSITTGEPDVAATFYVELISAPTADVTVTVMSDDTTEGMITTGASLTFTTGNWNIRQSVTVTGQDDNLIDVDTSYNITLASTSSDANYNALTETLSATNTDDDVAVDICSRTTEVQTAILNAISPSPTCSTVTESQLAAITGTLDLFSAGISALLAGDFAGLAGLTELDLFGNSLSALPDNIFNDLTSLTELDLGINLLSALPTGVFNDLTSLTELGLNNNSLTTLPSGVFNMLSNLTILRLNNNSLSALPAGVFDGLTSLTDLQLQNNTFTTPLPANLFDPLPDAAVIQIDLSPIGDLVDIPSLTLGGVATINVANAFISRTSTGTERALSFTITPTGTSVVSATESSGVLTITASDTIAGVTTIDIVADDSVSSTVTRNIAVTVTEPAVNICDRTTIVETAILAAIPANPACDAVTATQLAAITGVFDLSGVRIQTLQVGDFAGLSGVTSLNLRSNFIFTANALPAGVFTGLTSLTELNLGNHPFVPALQAGLFDDLTSLEILHLDELTRLTALPAGVFDNLTNLTQLNLRNAALTALPAGVFDNLMSLTRLQLEFNALSALPAGVFDNLMSLTRLDLNSNALTALPAGVFDGLTSLEILHLFNNNLTALPAGLFDNLASLTELNLDNNTFTTPLPADIFDSISSADISLGLFPIGELPGVALTASGTTTINVTNAFIDRDGTSNAVITNFSAMSNDTTVATAMESGGVVTITGAGMGTTTVSVTASSFGDTSTRDIAVTVVATGILAFDGTTGDTLATPIVAEASGTDTFYVQLASAPASDVTLTLTSSDTSEGTVMPGTLTFTAAAGSTSWDTRQLVTVTAVDDNSDRDGDSFTVNFAVTAGDGGDYPIALAIPNVTVTITDDDTAGIDAYDMLTGGSEITTITTSETGAGNVATFYVALTSQPTGTVTVTISGLVATEHTLTAPVSDTLTFTPTGATAWNTRQVITLNSVDDNVVDGDQMYDLTLTPTGGDYTGVAAQTVSVTNSDTDTAVLTIADMMVNEDAGTATLTVTLTPAVTAGDVTVNATTANGTATAGEDYTAIASQTLTFTAGSTSETLDIAISGDNIAEGNETFTVMLDTLVQPTGVTTVSITDATAEVTITDDETAPTTIDLGVSPSTIAETADATEIIVTATLGDGSASLLTDTVVTLTISGTATGGGTDYTLTMPISTINIAALATSATKTFMIDPIDDSTTEGEETVEITGTATINGMTATGMDTLTILEAGILVFESSTGDTAPDVVATEDGGMDTFYVRLASQPANDVTLSLTSSDANEGTVSPLTLTFTAAAGATSWDTRQLVTVTAVPDGIDRDDTFTVNFGITDGDGANYETATLTLPMVTVTVTDDDTVGFTVDIGDGVTTSEGSTTPDTFSVVLDSEPTDTVTVTIDGLVTTEHTFPPLFVTTLMFTTTNWSTAQTITLNSVDDNVVDGDQMYDLTLTPAGGDYTGVAAQTVSVTNSDTDTAELTIADATVNEGDGMATLTVTLSAMVTVGTVEVNANTIASGTATEGADYTNTNQALTFLAGSTSETLDIPINDDSIVEGDETFAVRLSTLVTPPGVTTVRLASDRTAEVTIIDNDMPGLAVDIGDGVTTSEGSTASDTFSVVLNTQPTADVTVTISGLVTTEHSLTPSTTLTFTPTGATAWNTRQVITLNSVDDNVVDGDQMYDLTLTPAGGDYTGVAAQTVSVTNSDTDTAVLTIADMSVDEDAGTATVTVTLTPAVTAGNVLVDATTMDGTATTAGTDYTAITSQTLTFTAGSTSETLDITINDDTIAEGNETFTVMLGGLSVPSAVSGDVTIATDDTAEVTITDDETVPTTIDLGVSPSTIAETAGATDITVTATLGDGSISLPTDTVVTLTISGTATITTDYTLTIPISTITIAALATSATKTFMIDPTDDTKTESDETVIIGGTATINGMTATGTDTLTIVEAGILVFDAAAGDTAPDVVATEDGGTDTFYVRLASAPARDVTLTLTSSDANEGTVDPPTLTFTAAVGATSWDTRQLVTVTAVDDDIDRDDPFTVDFEIATAGDGDGANYLTTLTLPSVTVTVTDDDTVGFTVDIGDGVTTSEGSATPDTFSVVLNSQPTADVTVEISGLDSTEHSLAPSTTLMFATGDWDTAQTVMLTGENDDDVDGDQTYDLTLTPTGGDYTGVAAQTVSVTNTDTDTATLSIADMSVNEDAGTATVTVTLTPAVTAGTVTVNAMTVDGTATGADYTAITSQTLTFTAGSTSETLSITISDDSIAEGNEAFTVMLNNLVQPTGVTTVSITDATAEVTIIDDDVPGLRVDIGGDVTTSEGSATPDTFSVVLNTQPTADVTVTISGLDAGEHTLTPSTTLMFTTTNWSTAQTVTLNSVDDNVIDGDQTYDLTLTASGGDYTGVAAQTVSITNSDDDTAMVTIADATVNEDAGTATVTVTLSAIVTTGDVTVQATTADGTATAGTDYTVIASQTLTITAGTISQTLDITINDDTIAEGNETFTVMLNNLMPPTGVTTVSITDATATVTITDNETPPTTIDLGVSPSTIAETADATTITVTAALGTGRVSLLTDTEVTLTISGTATINTDYTLTMPISTIAIAALATSATKTFMIDPIDDSTTEGEETVEITGTATINGMTAMANLATLTITEFSDEDQQAIEQTVAAQASGITQVVTEQIGIRLVSRASTSSGSGGNTQDRQSLSSIDWQDDLAKFTYEGLKRLDSEADMSLDWLLQAAGGNGQLLMPLGAESLTLWATGGRISTKGDGVSDYDGDVNSFILGIDTAFSNDWLAGVAISYNDSEVDYTMEGTPEANKTEQTLYGIHPYLSYTLSQGLTLWATGGYGFGDIDFSHTTRGQATSDVTQWMAAGGLEKQIITNTPWQGALRIKGLWGNAEVDAAEYSGGIPIAKVDSDFWRARMESELGYNFPLSGANIRPYALIGARWDHNDAIVSGDEWHVDVGGGVELSDNAFALNISVRTQVTDGDTEEDSIFATGSLTYDLEQDGQGLQIALSRSLDNTSPAWDSHSFSPLTDTASGLSAAPLTSELAYGWMVRPFGLKGALQTYVQNSFDSHDRHYAVGLELAVNALTLSFETGYHDHTSLNSGETDNTGLESMLKTKIRW